MVFFLPLEWQAGFRQCSSALFCCLCYQNRGSDALPVYVRVLPGPALILWAAKSETLWQIYFITRWASLPKVLIFLLSVPHLTHSALSWSFLPLLFSLLFPLCFSKFLSLSCFLFLFFASRFPSPVCCHPWLFMALQNFSVLFHLAGVQPLSIHRSFLVVVDISSRNLAPLFCLTA